jgi:hypothetical protein
MKRADRKVIGALMMAGALAAPAAAIETRPPSEAETLSFAAYYHQRHPGALFKSSFEIQRDSGEQSWRITAWAESAPQRAAWRLCLVQRSGYSYDAKEQRWSDNGQQRRYVWLDRAADCGVSPERVQLKHELSDRDIVTVLEQQDQVLQSARLLFAGNTQCAPQRAHNFKLEAIDVSPDQLYQLTYRSDRGGVAQVAVRKRARELTAWTAHC